MPMEQSNLVETHQFDIKMHYLQRPQKWQDSAKENRRWQSVISDLFLLLSGDYGGGVDAHPPLSLVSFRIIRPKGSADLKMEKKKQRMREQGAASEMGHVTCPFHFIITHMYEKICATHFDFLCSNGFKAGSLRSIHWVNLYFSEGYIGRDQNHLLVYKLGLWSKVTIPVYSLAG